MYAIRSYYVLDADRLRATLYALDNRVAASIQSELLLLLEDSLRTLCRWELENREAQSLEKDSRNNFV